MVPDFASTSDERETVETGSIRPELCYGKNETRPEVERFAQVTSRMCSKLKRIIIIIGGDLDRLLLIIIESVLK